MRLTNTGDKSLELLAVSFAYPPAQSPRSIQVARLIKFLDASTTVVCADEVSAVKDTSILSDGKGNVSDCIRVPFAPSWLSKSLDRLSFRLYRPVWDHRNATPDPYRTWRSSAIRSITDLMHDGSFRPNVMATFAQPFSDLLVGLEIKRRSGLPWLAHFSDPWVDNPFTKLKPSTRSNNAVLEREVATEADLLVFTSEETLELVMAKYPAELKQKARVLSHMYDPSLFMGHPPRGGDELVIRYVGDFYGPRTPLPLINTLLTVFERDPTVLNNVVFELIGLVDETVVQEATGGRLPNGLLAVHSSVPYRKSLELISSADGLLVIDAPTETNVFLPSKIVDYIGAGRPILGLTPKGASARLINELGGMVAEPNDEGEMSRQLVRFVSLLKQRRQFGSTETWGDPLVRGRYEARHVADEFKTMLTEIVAGD